MIQRFVIGKPFPTESVVLDLPAETGPVPYLTPDGDGWQYVMQEKDIVYGLGEMPRGLNKRGGYTRHDTLRFATAEPNYALYLITAPTAAEVAKEFRQLIGPSYIPPKWAFGLAQSRFGYKTEADIRDVSDYDEEVLPAGRHYLPCELNEVLLFIRPGHRPVAQPAANTAQLNDTALTFWRFAPDGQPAPYRMYTDDGVTTDHNKPEHWRIVGQ